MTPETRGRTVKAPRTRCPPPPPGRPGSHRLPDVRQREPQREDDGDDEKVGEALAGGLGPGQAERLVLLLLLLGLGRHTETMRGKEGSAPAAAAAHQSSSEPHQSPGKVVKARIEIRTALIPFPAPPSGSPSQGRGSSSSLVRPGGGALGGAGMASSPGDGFQGHRLQFPLGANKKRKVPVPGGTEGRIH